MKRLTERLPNGVIRVNFIEAKENAVSRLAAIEDILGDEYDLDRLSVLCNQRMTMRDELSQRFSLTAKIPLDRLRELALTDREGEIPKYTIGDTVYDKYGEPWQVVSAELHSMRTKNEWLYRCGHEGTDDYRALWHFEAFPSREAALRREQDG